jgi:antitoxin HicB
MDNLYYYAKVKYDKKDNIYMVSFPQFSNINTYGETLDEALMNAKEALEGCLLSDFVNGFEIQKPVIYKGENYYKIGIDSVYSKILV